MKLIARQCVKQKTVDATIGLNDRPVPNSDGVSPTPNRSEAVDSQRVGGAHIDCRIAKNVHSFARSDGPRLVSAKSRGGGG